MFLCLNWSLAGSSEKSKKKISSLGFSQGCSSIFSQATFIGFYTTYVIGFHCGVEMCNSQ